MVCTHPLDREVILKEVQPKDDVMKLLTDQDLNLEGQDDHGTILADITLDEEQSSTKHKF